jgi:hypothetical protein
LIEFYNIENILAKGFEADAVSVSADTAIGKRMRGYF